ncbi:pyridoxal phosphate-dependent aminotransferase [Clostridium massiliamazoniense]|uniref:pyridoxal phosphate-dependent aminotransferase n=1 Tax=Clostridium massiliamazoniense TaxID=1347366 RepID=UPI0006D7767D|nr:histidinol-phosphate transaminase [Clostridium massiliamazoniense]
MTVNHGANIFDLSKNLGLSKDSLLDFSSNINPFGASKKAQEGLKENIHMVSMYPDPEYKELKSSISSYCQCNSDNIILGSGATELISSFIKTISPKKALLLSPSYSEYEKELNKNNCITEKFFAKKENEFVINVEELISSINQSAYDLVIICNPNNPTGFAFTALQIEEILKNTNSFIMIDETYIEFTDLNIFSSSKLTDKYEKLFVIRGTSKFFSTPGIRLGYALSSQKDLKDAISKNIDLWNINIFASIMGEIMFKDVEYIKDTYAKLEKEREFLLTNLRKFNSLKVFNSYGNFILCEIKDQSISSTELYNKLLSKGLIIRNCSSFPTLSDYFFRVCILKPEHNILLIDNLKELLD